MTQHTAEQRDQLFNQIWSKYDKDGSNELCYDEFRAFLIEYEEQDLPEDQTEFYFKGTDIDGMGKVGKNELFKLVEALDDHNQLEINKLFFRAIDKDRSNQIDAKEFIVLARLNGLEMTEEKAQNSINKITGGTSTTLSFAQMHKKLTKQDIPLDTDPYDGLNVKKVPKPVPKPQDPPKHEEPKPEEKPKPQEKPNPPKEEPKPQVALKPEEKPTSQTSMPSKMKLPLMILSGLSIVFLILGAYSSWYTYNKVFVAVVDFKLNTGIKPFDITKGSLGTYGNLQWYSRTVYLTPFILFIVFTIIEIIAIIGYTKELTNPMLKNLTDGPVIRGLTYFCFGFPFLGVTAYLGSITGLGLMIVGATLIIIGILRPIVDKPSQPTA